MRKGKFGIVLCFYPIAAFAAVILNAPLICAAIAAAAIFLEKDEWAGRQTLQACMASALVFFFDHLLNWGLDLVYIPYITNFLSVVATIIFVLVYLAAVILSILAIIRVRKDEEANFPLLSELAYRIYGQRKPKPVAPPVQQYAAPYGMPQQPVQQPYPTQGAYPAAPSPAPQYAPPVSVQPAYGVQPPQEPQPSVGPQPPQEPGQDGTGI